MCLCPAAGANFYRKSAEVINLATRRPCPPLLGNYGAGGGGGRDGLWYRSRLHANGNV